MTYQVPSVGRIVHYVSYGTPGGEFPSVCRAAIITEVVSGDEAIGVCVLNPTGIFFNEMCLHDEDDHRGGSWHWPERV